MTARRTHSGPWVDAPFGAVLFDWDGTAVPDRRASVVAVRKRVEQLCALGVHVAVVSGTPLGDVDGQLQARPAGPGRLLLGLNHGSELFEVTAAGPHLLGAVAETPERGARLDEAAARLATELGRRGLAVEVVSGRLNRRRLDLIPKAPWCDPSKAEIAKLVTAVTERIQACGVGSLAEVVQLAATVSAECGLDDALITSDGKHVVIGLTDKSDSVRAILRELAAVGVGPGLVLMVGDEFGSLGGVPGSDAMMLVAPRMTVISVGVEPEGVPAGVRHVGGGSLRFGDLLDEQLDLRAAHRVPTVDLDPAWTVAETGVDAHRNRVSETLFTLSAGGFGTRGAVEETGPVSRPLVVAAGVYAGDGASDGLLAAPDWTQVSINPAPKADCRVLDLRTGVLYREEAGDRRPRLRSMRFASLAEPGAMAMRVEAGIGRMGKGAEGGTWRMVRAPDLGGVGMAVTDTIERVDGIDTLERFAGFDGNPNRPPSRRRATTLLRTAAGEGFDRLLCEHRRCWARRWEGVDVRIPDDPETQHALRYALYTLWSVTSPGRELAVGARGVSGDGYSGHVFWDADVFVLPALMTINPASAKAMVRYRLDRLGAARAEAHARGREGARFPWESARTGHDVTPTRGYVGDEQVTIRTGDEEEHITADIAWAVVRRSAWSSAAGSMSSSERQLLADTARYWTSRCRMDDDGAAHIEGVIGPDEYHENVDDNAFTNVMARWNLRAAIRHCAADVSESERLAWEATAAALVDGYRPENQTYEQFRGYSLLKPLLAADVGTPPLAADALLGQDRVSASQLIKQPDVLMLHHLIPDEVAAGSLEPTLDLYGPRTSHGSSLSPAIMALLAARASRVDEGLDLLRLALRIDLNDLGGTTSAGLHVATAGGAWQALLFGFLGARVAGGMLLLDPHLPTLWRRLEVRFRCLGADVRVRVDGARVSASASRRIRAAVDGPPVELRAQEFALLTGGERP